ncbi:MAG: DUF5906 domain-containing protein [Prevotella sp.]|nr:DUF5906 domain-containing protein [Prevotella sp.]
MKQFFIRLNTMLRKTARRVINHFRTITVTTSPQPSAAQSSTVSLDAPSAPQSSATPSGPDLSAVPSSPERTATPSGTKPSDAPSIAVNRQRLIRFNEQFLAERYDLRYNMMKRITEFRRKNTKGAATNDWHPLTERDLNHLTVEQLKAGGESWSYGMRLCLENTAIDDYHPVRAYLAACPAWDGHDHIGDMARRVPTSYTRWPEYFHRWMLAMTAQALGMGGLHGNSLVPLLIGDQGTRKSIFCRNILPPQLRDYFMDDIKMDNAEQVERVLGRMWLVCIDEYDSKTPREQAKIKRLLTEKDVQVRRMRSDQYTMTERLASFIATTNDPTPLPSGDGTRRYLCVAVDGMIDTDSPVCWEQVFAQAQAELRQEGCLWWFTAEDEQEIQQHNRQYQQPSAIEQVLPTFFEPAPERSHEHFWQVTAIQRELASTLRASDVPNLTRLGLALKALRWPQGSSNGRRGYYLLKKQ